MHKYLNKVCETNKYSSGKWPELGERKIYLEIEYLYENLTTEACGLWQSLELKSTSLNQSEMCECSNSEAALPHS